MRHAPLFEPGMRSRKEIGVARRKHVHSAFGDQQQVVAHCRRLASLSKHLVLAHMHCCVPLLRNRMKNNNIHD